jgi:hypothetical protein
VRVGHAEDPQICAHDSASLASPEGEPIDGAALIPTVYARSQNAQPEHSTAPFSNAPRHAATSRAAWQDRAHGRR